MGLPFMIFCKGLNKQQNVAMFNMQDELVVWGAFRYSLTFSL